jgi:hypothetical protein
MTSAPNLSSQLIELVRLREQVDRLAQALLPSRSLVFGSISLATPNVETNAELAFIRTVSWLYSYYFELGRVGVRFLVRRNATAAAGRGHGHEHLDLVHALRTWSQHSINPSSGHHDARIAEICETWFEMRCKTRLPRLDEHWHLLLAALLDEACDFMALLLSLLDAIEHDDDRDVICQQWDDRVMRDWPAHRYHGLIAKAAADLGRNALDPVAFYERHGQSIRDALRLLSDEADLEVEARKRIELTLINETLVTLPITGHDVIEYFDVRPGPVVGQIMMHALRLHQEEPCGRDELLERLRLVCGELLGLPANP